MYLECAMHTMKAVRRSAMHNHDVAVNQSTFKIMTKDGSKSSCIPQLALDVLTKACPVIQLSANSLVVIQKKFREEFSFGLTVETWIPDLQLKLQSSELCQVLRDNIPLRRCVSCLRDTLAVYPAHPECSAAVQLTFCFASWD